MLGLSFERLPCARRASTSDPAVSGSDRFDVRDHRKDGLCEANERLHLLAGVRHLHSGRLVEEPVAAVFDGRVLRDRSGKSRQRPQIRLQCRGERLGVPITSASTRMYLLCCLARERRPDLGSADVEFLRGVAASLCDHLARPADRR
jgi:hypothetical protein